MQLSTYFKDVSRGERYFSLEIKSLAFFFCIFIVSITLETQISNPVSGRNNPRIVTRCKVSLSVKITYAVGSLGKKDRFMPPYRRIVFEITSLVLDIRIVACYAIFRRDSHCEQICRLLCQS